jgi:hypothetical protein
MVDKREIRHETVASNDIMDVHAVRKNAYGESSSFTVMAHDRLQVDRRALFALACIERWGMIAADADGEDSAGRQKARRLTVDEVVQHACDCAEKAYASFGSRGWLLHVPGYAELEDKLKDRENGN